MTLAMALILVGLLLIYAGVKGRSVTGLLTGRSEPSAKPKPVAR